MYANIFRPTNKLFLFGISIGNRFLSCVLPTCESSKTDGQLLMLLFKCDSTLTAVCKLLLR